MLDANVRTKMDERELRALFQLGGTQSMSAIGKAIRLIQDGRREVLETSPRRDDKNLEFDAVYILGEIRGMKRILQLIDELNKKE